MLQFHGVVMQSDLVLIYMAKWFLIRSSKLMENNHGRLAENLIDLLVAG